MENLYFLFNISLFSAVTNNRTCDRYLIHSVKIVNFNISNFEFIQKFNSPLLDWRNLWRQNANPHCNIQRQSVSTVFFQVITLTGRWEICTTGSGNNLVRIVTAIIWARSLCGLALRDACFRRRITRGVVLIRSLKQIRTGPELAGSEETREAGREQLKCGSPSYWTSWTAFLLLFLRFPQRLEWYSFPPIWERFCFVTGCYWNDPSSSSY